MILTRPHQSIDMKFFEVNQKFDESRLFHIVLGVRCDRSHDEQQLIQQKAVTDFGLESALSLNREGLRDKICYHLGYLQMTLAWPCVNRDP